jgi:hypothetical protein
MTEMQRQKLWRERLNWQQLSEASRRARWLRMKEEQKRMLGCVFALRLCTAA